jgi:hypothetical protein
MMVTRTANELTDEAEKEEPDHIFLVTKLTRLESLAEKLVELDQKMTEIMLDFYCDDEEHAEEIEGTEEYATKIEMTRLRVQKILSPPVVCPRSQSPTPSNNSYQTVWTEPDSSKKRNFKLPKIELKKYNGDLKGWLGWWSQFDTLGRRLAYNR